MEQNQQLIDSLKDRYENMFKKPNTIEITQARLKEIYDERCEAVYSDTLKKDDKK